MFFVKKIKRVALRILRWVHRKRDIRWLRRLGKWAPCDDPAEEATKFYFSARAAYVAFGRDEWRKPRAEIHLLASDGQGRFAGGAIFAPPATLGALRTLDIIALGRDAYSPYWTQKGLNWLTSMDMAHGPWGGE